MAELSYQKIRSANQAREADEVRTDTRRKNLLLLVMHYLNEEGFAQSANSLSKETNLDFNKFEVCDNVDLETIIMEYESYYYIKFQRYPKITKKLHEDVKQQYRMNGKLKNNNRSSSTPSLPRISYTNQTAVANPPVAPSSNSARPKSGNVRRQTSQRTATEDPKRKEPLSSLGEEAANLLQHNQGQTQAQLNGNINNNSNPASAFENENHGLQGLVIHGRQDQNAHDSRKPKAGQIIDYRSMLNQETRITVEEDSRVFDPQERLIKPLGNFLGYNGEWRELAMTISRDIYTNNPNVRWDDIIGLDTAKRLVKESVVYPIRYPQLFTGILSPWKGLLLYGPPGTGKTLLAKAVATECNTTFFNVSASTIVSKWRGDSEKLVRVLFELARFHAPSTIFLDELESIMSQRGSQGGGQEHEGSRRMKTELLVQMDGLAKSDDLVFLLAASNLPWELDYAMLRRLEKRIIVGLPTTEARRQMFLNFLPPKVRSDPGSLELTCNIDYDYCAEKTEGYSGSDIKLVCKEAAMRVVRKIFDALENSLENDELHIKLDPLTTADVEAALKTTKPSARGLADKYSAWQKEYESV